MSSHPKYQKLIAYNRRLAKSKWGASIDLARMHSLADMTRAFGFSVANGDILLLEGRWYVTHVGLIRLATQRRCAGIHAQPVTEFCNPATGFWSFKATVYKTRTAIGFTSYGDASPSNISPLVHGAEMRVAETRAVNRALRKAYGIGLCSVEELGWQSGSSPAPAPNDHNYWTNNANGNRDGHGANNGQRLRDQLCILIRKYNLDPNLVKQYAADYCGTAALKDASRELVASFISHLAGSAQQNRDALICKLNSYSHPVEAKL